MNNNTNYPIKELDSSNRFTFLLHLWHSAGQWRASLQNLETGKRFGFADLEQLFSYLMDLIEDNFNRQPNTEIEQRNEPGKRN